MYTCRLQFNFLEKNQKDLMVIFLARRNLKNAVSMHEMKQLSFNLKQKTDNLWSFWVIVLKFSFFVTLCSIIRRLLYSGIYALGGGLCNLCLLMLPA